MVSPVELKIQYDVSKTSYIKKLTALKTIEKSKDSEQMNVQPQLRTVNDANAIEK
jgi:chromatin remodeling complex protein RSC6